MSIPFLKILIFLSELINPTYKIPFIFEVRNAVISRAPQGMTVSKFKSFINYIGGDIYCEICVISIV